MTAQRITYTVIPSKFEEDLDKDLYEGKPEKYNMVSIRLRRIHAGAKSRNYLADSEKKDWIGTC